MSYIVKRFFQKIFPRISFRDNPDMNTEPNPGPRAPQLAPGGEGICAGEGGHMAHRGGQLVFNPTPPRQYRIWFSLSYSSVYLSLSLAIVQVELLRGHNRLLLLQTFNWLLYYYSF